MPLQRNSIHNCNKHKNIVDIQRPIKKEVSKLACLSYVVLFASIIGYFCPPITNYPYPTVVFIILGLISMILLVLKNRHIKDKVKVNQVCIQDIVFIVLACLTGKFIPNYMGLIKVLILVIPCAIYTQKTLYKFFN